VPAATDSPMAALEGERGEMGVISSLAWCGNTTQFLVMTHKKYVDGIEHNSL
jgi:hypothetical protein